MDNIIIMQPNRKCDVKIMCAMYDTMCSQLDRGFLFLPNWIDYETVQINYHKDET